MIGSYKTGLSLGWWEGIMNGPNGNLYLILAIVCAGLIVLVILIIIVILIVRCCRRKR